jgi:hypothetical protein
LNQTTGHDGENVGMIELIRKEYLRNRLTLLAVGIVLLLPYVFMVSRGIIGSLTGPPRNWMGLIWKASTLSSGIWTVAVAFIASMIMSGERSQRPSAYLPFDPHRALAAKAILALGVGLAYFLINISVFYVTRAGHYSAPVLNDMVETVGGTWLVTAALIFCASWLFSSLLTSPASAATGGLAAAAISGGVVTGLGGLGVIESVEVLKAIYFWLCLVLGVACFAAGVGYYLRRHHPA